MVPGSTGGLRSVHWAPKELVKASEASNDPLSHVAFSAVSLLPAHSREAAATSDWSVLSSSEATELKPRLLKAAIYYKSSALNYF